MKNLNFLSNLCGQGRASQSSDVGSRCRVVADLLPSFCRVNMLKLVSVLVLILTIGSGNVWGAETLKTTCVGTGSGYGTRRTATYDGIGWVLASGQSGYLGANNATNHGNVKPTAADLPVVKAQYASATTTTTGYYFYYTSTAIANVTKIEFSYTAKSGSSTVNAYVVSSSTAAASGSATWSKPTLASGTGLSAQGANIASATGTYTFKLNAKETSSKYYGIILKTGSYSRLTTGSIKIYVDDAVAVTYTVTYNKNNASASGTMTDSNSPYASGATVTVLANGFTAPSGKVFSHWDTKADDSGTDYVPGATFSISGNTTLYAQWATAYTVTYNLNGGTGTTPTESAKASGSTFTLHDGTTGITPPTKKVFSKWRDQDGTDYEGGDTYTMPSKNVTLTAQWVAAGGDYVLVEDAGDIGPGKYLIVYNNTYALNTHYGNVNANTYGTYTDISDYYNSKKIASNATTDALAYTVAETTNGYSIKRGEYLGCSSATNTGLRWDETFTASTDEWTLNVDEVRSIAQTGRYIRWNNNSGQYRFATYTSGSCQSIQLFKQEEACEELGTINGSVSWSGGNTATVTWANNSNVSSYSVTCKAGGVSAGSVGSITGTTTKTCSITSLTAGTTYTITINATGKSGYCDASQEITSIAPKLTNAATTLTGSNYAYGDGPGTEKSFTVTGIGLTGDITVTAPTDFEVSKSSGSGYASSVTYTPTSGSLSSTVFVRLAAGKSIGTYGASAITISGGGAANNTNVTIAGTVSSACTTAPTVSAATSSARTTSSITVNCAGISSLGTGTCTIDHYGFVYSTSANPKHTSDGGSGTVKEVGTAYTVTGTAFGATAITGLTKGTTYYVRPYAHNSCGWAYGDQVSVTTLDLSSIAISTAPTKTAYFVGETFVSTGAVVTATYSDASTATVSADWTPTTALSAGEQTITATYTENGTTKSTTTTVNVYAVTMQATDENGDAIAVGGPGAPTRSIKSISPAADAANYVFKQWTISGASLGSSATTKSNTITSPTGAVTVTAVYYKPRVVKWSVNGDDSYDEGSPTLTVAYNGTISAVPDAPDDDALSCANKFMGWSTKDAGTTPKTTSYYDDLFTNASGYTTNITAATTTFYAVFAEAETGAWTLDYSEETALSSSTDWGSYGTAYDYTASDGGTWTVKAYKNAGMQINTGKDASIKIPDCSGYITSIEITCSAAKAVGLSASDYTGAGDITYIAYGTDATSQTIDCSGGTATGGYIVPKSGSTVITKIVVNYGAASDYVTACDATKAKVTYDLNGGSGGCSTGLYTKEGFKVCNTAVTKTGYTFAGWNDGTSTYAANASYTLTGNVTFTAQWTPVEYTITYNLDGGTNNIGNPASYTIESSDITLLTPTKTTGGYEYDFTGWTDDDNSDAAITTIAAGSTGNKHVTAHWAQKKRVRWYVGNTVQWTTFYASDGSGSLTLPNGGTPPSVPPTCGSKVFAGWTSDTPWDGETDTEPTVLFKAASGTVSADVDYYAVWADEHSEEAEGEIFSDDFNVSGTSDVTSRDNWTSLSTVYGGDGSIRFSSGKNAGSMTLVKTGLGFGTTVTEATITFKIKKYGSDGSGVLKVSSNFSDATTTFSKDGGETTSTSGVQYSTTDGSSWTTCTCTVGSISAATDIILDGQANSRVYVKDFVIEASGTTYTYDKYAIVCCNDPELAFGQTRYSLIREDLHGNTSAAYSTIELTYSSSSSGAIRVWTQYDEDDNPEHNNKTAWQYTGANTWGTSPTTGGSAATASSHAYFEITDAANGKAKFYVKNTAGNTQGQGTYRVALHQAANGGYCETVTYCWIDVTLRDKFVDAVNGNTFPNADGHGSGGAAVTTPAESTRDADKDDDCHETTRRLVGWVKETDMESWYGTGQDRTRDLDDKTANITAPGATITTTGVTWYAVWGEENE